MNFLKNTKYSSLVYLFELIILNRAREAKAPV